MQLSHSRHQKTTSNLRRIHLKGKSRFGNGSPLEGAMYINLWSNIWGHPEYDVVAILSKYGWFQTKRFTRILQFTKLHKQNPLVREFFYFRYLPKLHIGFKVHCRAVLFRLFPKRLTYLQNRSVSVNLYSTIRHIFLIEQVNWFE